MSAVRDKFVHGLMGTVGVVFGILAAVGLAVAAIVPAILGLLAFLISPLRAIVRRVLHPRTRA